MSAPGLNWDAMLKTAKIKLELITDPDIYIFLEKGARGETYWISNKCSKANNKSLKSYDLKPKTRIKKDHILRRK